jgi:nitroreductase
VIPRARATAFGDVLAAAYARRCHETGVPVDPERRARERVRAARAPVYLVTACQPRLDMSIPAHEQLAAVAAATQNLLLAATALGFGSKWVTGAAATDLVVKRALGHAEHDSIVGFVQLGSIPDGDRARPRRTDAVGTSVRYWFDESRESIPVS